MIFPYKFDVTEEKKPKKVEFEAPVAKPLKRLPGFESQLGLLFSIILQLFYYFEISL